MSDKELGLENTLDDGRLGPKARFVIQNWNTSVLRCHHAYYLLRAIQSRISFV